MKQDAQFIGVAVVGALIWLALAGAWSHTLDATLCSKMSLFTLGNFLHLPGVS